MPIETTYEPGIRPGTLRTVYRVDGDQPYKTHTTEEAAQKREAELAARSTSEKQPPPATTQPPLIG